MDEKEYIERDALLQFLKNEIKQCEDDYGDDFEEDDYYTQAVDSRMTAMRCVKHRVETSPAADVAPVVHSEWILNDDGSGRCKRCKRRQMNVWDDDNWQRYCGDCGAKMDGVKRVYEI